MRRGAGCHGTDMRWGVVLAATLVVGWSCHREIVFDDLGTCDSDPDCVLPSLHCAQRRCVACFSDAHCTNPLRPRCDTALLRCVECGVSADCSAGATCRRGHCSISCAAGCPPSAPTCDDGFCIECGDEAACASSSGGAVCIDNVCSGCSADSDCKGALRRCDPVRHACVECEGHGDCSLDRPLCDPDVNACVAVP